MWLRNRQVDLFDRGRKPRSIQTGSNGKELGARKEKQCQPRQPPWSRIGLHGKQRGLDPEKYDMKKNFEDVGTFNSPLVFSGHLN
jgi:hypothetical protein